MYYKMIDLKENIQAALATMEREAGQLTHEELEARYGKDPKILLAYYLYGFSKGGWDKVFYCYKRVPHKLKDDPVSLSKKYAASLYREKFADIAIRRHNTFLSEYLDPAKVDLDIEELPGLIVLLVQVYKAAGKEQGLLKKIFTANTIENMRTIFVRGAKILPLWRDDKVAYYQELGEELLERLAALYDDKGAGNPGGAKVLI